MKEGFRQSMAWLHNWSGLIVGWVLFFVFLTGTTGYFDDEITRWMQPERPLASIAPPMTPAAGVAKAQAYLARTAPEAPRWSIDLPGGRGQTAWTVSWPRPDRPGSSHRPERRARGDHGEGRQMRMLFDPVAGSGTPLPSRADARDTSGGVGLYRLHYRLHYVSQANAILIVGACTMLMLLAIVSGIITHKKIFKDFFTFRPAKGQRSWLDMHNVISVCALPFFLMITYTGLMFFMYAYMPAAMNLTYGLERQWDNDGYSNPLNPRANAQFMSGPERGAERGEDRRGRPRGAAILQESGTAAPLADLSSMVTRAETLWGQGTVESLIVENPGKSRARVTISRFPRGLTADAGDRMRFDGVTAALIERAPPRGRGTWQVQDSMIALHEGLFAGPVLRWLYFASGLLGCAMVGTGLILWTVKRRQKQINAGRSDYGFRLVECLNIAAIIGMPLGIAAYFWANRLLPAPLETRAAWEMHSLFIAIGMVLFWAAVRPPRKAWTEGLCLCAAAYALLPPLNALTTDRHLGITVPAGDWGLAGFDLTVAGIGLALAIAARRVAARSRSDVRGAR
ncbi:PepSY-associated TM helix domain-containing protein [Sphingobium yanoikuyae]|uniref:PepSY-associated TM helix domain-containing protein n=1 Tax=Sphingobium yanoikuyae TaxID=13690 RepID=UPI002432D5B2|nr:PepSY-associated TM helix domain-containing protein [Sphingobium yanoikuyae]